MIRPFLALLATLGLAATTLIPSAGAQTGATKPEPGCAGLAVKDAEADSTGGENQEITALFFRTVGNKTTANVQVKNLDQSIPVDGTGVTWYVVWEAADGFRFVSADVDTFSGLTFNTGTYDGTTYSQTGETAGKLWEGPNGVIELTVPSEAGAGRGKTLGDPYAVATTAASVPLVGGLVSTTDAAPDAGGGKDYVVTPCEGEPAPPPPNPGTGETPATLPVTALTTSVKAKKTRKKKRLTVRLRADDAVSDVGLRLRKGAKTAGRGKVASIASGETAKVRLKLRRKLRKGTYVLEVGGTSQGRKGTNAFNIKVR